MRRLPILPDRAWLLCCVTAWLTIVMHECLPPRPLSPHLGGFLFCAMSILTFFYQAVMQSGVRGCLFTDHGRRSRPTTDLASVEAGVENSEF